MAGNVGNLIGDFSDSAVLGALLDALESAGLGCAVVLAYPDRLETAYSNHALSRMNGIPFEQMKERHPFSAVPPDEQAKLTKLRWAVRNGETEPPTVVPSRFVHPDGKVVPIEICLGYSLLGEQRATFAFARDLTEKVAMEAALRESEDRFRKLAEASPDSITIYVGKSCVYANPKALELFGLKDVSELATFNARALIPADRQHEADELTARVRRGEVVAPFVNRRKVPNGEHRTLEASVTRSTINGEPASLVYTRDITERVHLQAELMKQDRLASLGVLAAGVAHELNNPLAALSLLVRRLRAESSERGGGHDLGVIERIEDATQRMTTIIGDLLFLARPGDQPHAHVDLRRVLASSIALLRAGVTNCPPIVEEIESLPAIQAVPSRLGQVFLNVLRNAIEAVEGVAHGEVVLRAGVVDSDVVISVKDNGVGIPDDVLPRLMTPFFTTKERGTGLGLWICQTIVNAHHGGIAIKSAPGEGTTVTITLPT
jgi:two-component system sporulation sensor kinase A